MVGAEESEWRELTRTVESALARRPPSTRRQVALLIRLLDLAPLARHFRRLRSLDLPTRTAFLARLQDSDRRIVRRGVWGLRTLVFLGYYTRPDVYARIGYEARAEGWEAHRERSASANGGGSPPTGGGAQSPVRRL